MNAQPDDVEDDIVFLEMVCSTPDGPPRPLEGIARQKAEEYLEQMKIWHPQEYEELMKQRERILREREAKKKQDPQ